MKINKKVMKLETLEKTVAAVRQRAQILQSKAHQLATVARTAKAKARKAKAELKLAKQEAKRMRRAAKQAKRTLKQTLSASEAAARELARLETKITRARKSSVKPNAKSKKHGHSFASKRAESKSRPRSTKPTIAKPAPKTATLTKPATVSEPNSTAPRKEPVIQVPRDFKIQPRVSPTSTFPGSNEPTPLGEKLGK